MTRLIGYIGVDAGLCWIGDPCYVLPDDASHREEFRDWGKFCEEVADHITHVFPMKHGHGALGIAVRTGYGDGLYPVTAEIKNGLVLSVTVDFT